MRRIHCIVFTGIYDDIVWSFRSNWVVMRSPQFLDSCVVISETTVVPPFFSRFFIGKLKSFGCENSLRAFSRVFFFFFG